MKTVSRYIFLSVIFALSLSFTASEAPNERDARDVYKRLNESVAAIKSMEFNLVNYERIGDVVLRGEQQVTLTTSPFQCYILMIEPNKGEELIYAGGKYDFRAIYEPNGFPYLQFQLDPRGDLMRKNNHHTIFDLGFKSMMKMLNFHMAESEYKLEVSDVVLENKQAYKLSIDFTQFTYRSFEIVKKESISDLAARLMLNDYMLSLLNDRDISDILKVGSEITIPSSYAKRIELFIDKKNGLPFSQKVFDDKGLYERYEFSKLVINRPVSDDRFNSEFLGK